MEECLEWCPDEPSYFHVFDKRTGNLIKHKFQTKGFFFFHTINAYEQDDQIVLDILNYDDHALIETLRMRNLRAGLFETTSKSKPTRYVLPVGDLKEMKRSENLVTIANCQSTAVLNDKGVIKLVGQQLGHPGFEMPTINAKYIGKPYDFIYGTGFLEGGLLKNTIIKINIRTDTVLIQNYSTTSYPGEGKYRLC